MKKDPSLRGFLLVKKGKENRFFVVSDWYPVPVEAMPMKKLGVHLGSQLNMKPDNPLRDESLVSIPPDQMVLIRW